MFGQSCVWGERRRGTQEGNAGVERQSGVQEGSAGGKRRRGAPEWSAGGVYRVSPVSLQGGVSVGSRRMSWKASKRVRQRGISGVTPGVLLLGAAACPGGLLDGCYPANPRNPIPYTTRPDINLYSGCSGRVGVLRFLLCTVSVFWSGYHQVKPTSIFLFLCLQWINGYAKHTLDLFVFLSSSIARGENSILIPWTPSQTSFDKVASFKNV